MLPAGDAQVVEIGGLGQVPPRTTHVLSPHYGLTPCALDAQPDLPELAGAPLAVLRQAGTSPHRAQARGRGYTSPADEEEEEEDEAAQAQPITLDDLPHPSYGTYSNTAAGAAASGSGGGGVPAPVSPPLRSTIEGAESLYLKYRQQHPSRALDGEPSYFYDLRITGR